MAAGRRRRPGRATAAARRRPGRCAVSADPGSVVVIWVTLAGTGIRSAYACHRELAERMAADAAGSLDTVIVMPPSLTITDPQFDDLRRGEFRVDLPRARPRDSELIRGVAWVVVIRSDPWRPVAPVNSGPGRSPTAPARWGVPIPHSRPEG